jgi:hypothetical protein
MVWVFKVSLLRSLFKSAYEVGARQSCLVHDTAVNARTAYSTDTDHRNSEWSVEVELVTHSLNLGQGGGFLEL